jgi:hypothetical protein
MTPPDPPEFIRGGNADAGWRFDAFSEKDPSNAEWIVDVP